MDIKEKEEIKRAILNSVSNTDCSNPMLLAITTCEAINFINHFDSKTDSSSEGLNLVSDSDERINQYIKKIDRKFNEIDSQTLKEIETLKSMKEKETIKKIEALKKSLEQSLLVGKD